MALTMRWFKGFLDYVEDHPKIEWAGNWFVPFRFVLLASVDTCLPAMN